MQGFCGSESWSESRKKKFVKRRKKFLTNGKWSDRISKLTAIVAGGSVPCKLNNAKTNKHLDNYGLFKRFRTNNSQRKFLSIFARQIIQKHDFRATALRYHFLRVWSWLRTNAGGVPNTCKSNGVTRACSCNLVANGWVTREEPAFQWGTTVGNDC